MKIKIAMMVVNAKGDIARLKKNQDAKLSETVRLDSPAIMESVQIKPLIKHALS